MDGATLSIQTVAPVILVAEREPTARSSLSELLREEGYRVIEAADSSAAADQLSSDPNIRIILTDLEMPSWASIVKLARSQLPESFILGMLRYGALANALEAQRLGAQAYLLKPLDFAEVNQWIQRCLAGQSSIKI
jgi:DNA-binding NtrC family response regulator